MKIQIVSPHGTATVCEVDPQTLLTPHFRVREVANNRADEDIKLIYTPAMDEHLYMLEELRYLYGAPINISSAYRTASFNKSIGGDPDSEHLDGLATDILTGPLTDDQWAKWVGWWKAVCHHHNKIGQIRRYENFIHVGSDAGKWWKVFHVTDCREEKK